MYLVVINDRALDPFDAMKPENLACWNGSPCRCDCCRYFLPVRLRVRSDVENETRTPSMSTGMRTRHE